MVTAFFRVSKFTRNSFIYCCLISNTIKWTYSIKSLMYRNEKQLFVGSSSENSRPAWSFGTLSANKKPRATWNVFVRIVFLFLYLHV